MGDNNHRSVLIADDEPLARERIRRLVEALPGYNVCDEAGDGDEALEKTARLAPDILLLDIRMPGTDGMEAARRMASLEAPPAIIFCTAYDHYAIQAFDVHAVAYLLKPVRREALTDALNRAGRVNRVQLQALTEKQSGADEQLAIRTHRGTELIDIQGILYCEADQKYVTIHHLRGETVTDYTLKELESTYSQYLLRIHRHTLVGVRYIRALLKQRDGQNLIDLTGQHGQLPVSRRHAASLRQWLKEHRPG